MSINRSTLYYKAEATSQEEVLLLNEIRDIWSRYPFYGYRKITSELRGKGWVINRKRVQRLMKQGGIEAIYAKPKTSIKDESHKVYPYLLKGMDITRVNQAWQVDITYLRQGVGFMYLVALIDVYSRFVVGWSLSNTLDTQSCLDAFGKALKYGRSEIVNSDQGCQFTSHDWVLAVTEAGCKISMTGKGRCHDNIFIERFWRSFKQEEFYLNDYENVAELKQAIERYVLFYNHERWHQALAYRRPSDLFLVNLNKAKRTLKAIVL